MQLLECLRLPLQTYIINLNTFDSTLLNRAFNTLQFPTATSSSTLDHFSLNLGVIIPSSLVSVVVELHSRKWSIHHKFLWTSSIKYTSICSSIHSSPSHLETYILPWYGLFDWLFILIIHMCVLCNAFSNWFSFHLFKKFVYVSIYIFWSICCLIFALYTTLK